MTLFTDIVKLAEETASDGRRLVGQLADLLQARLREHPQTVFALLRNVQPVFVHGGMAVVTRYDDVVEVLTHDSDFSVQTYTGPMRDITGDFILGLDQGPQYERSVSLMRLAFRQSDVVAIADLAEKAAHDCISTATPNGEIDVVADLTDRVPARIVEHFLGAPGPDEQTLISWSRSLFTHIFVDLEHDRILTEQSEKAAAMIRPHLDVLVAARKKALNAGDPVPDDVMTRLLKQQVLGEQAFSDLEIRSNLIGMLVGMIPTVSKASALAIDELFRRPKELEAAREAVRSGDDALFTQYVNEAMRFSPQAPGLIRVAMNDYPIARGTNHERMIRKGTVVFASTQSAMLDGDVVHHPHEFRVDRPASTYLHYGAGMHSCYGRYLNAVLIPLIVKAAVMIEGVERAAGREGQLLIDGNWPTSMMLHFPVIQD